MLEANRPTVEVANDGKRLYLPVKGGEKIYVGSIVGLTAGYAQRGKKAEGLVAVGRAENFVDNTAGSDGEQYINVKRGVYLYNNDETNPVTAEHIMSDCYIFDDETVTSLATGASKAGKVLGFEDDQVMVEIR